MVSRRIEKFGLKPIVGDLVLADQSEVEESQETDEADGKVRLC